MARNGEQHAQSAQAHSGEISRFFLDHAILRHSARGRRWFTIDTDSRPFDTAQAAVAFIRSLEPSMIAA